MGGGPADLNQFGVVDDSGLVPKAVPGQLLVTNGPISLTGVQGAQSGVQGFPFFLPVAGGVQMGIPVVGVPIAQGIQNQIVGGMQVGLLGAGGMQVDY